MLVSNFNSSFEFIIAGVFGKRTTENYIQIFFYTPVYDFFDFVDKSWIYGVVFIKNVAQTWTCLKSYSFKSFFFYEQNLFFCWF